MKVVTLDLCLEKHSNDTFIEKLMVNVVLKTAPSQIIPSIMRRMENEVGENNSFPIYKIPENKSKQ
jgi:hypothetical protein